MRDCDEVTAIVKDCFFVCVFWTLYCGTHAAESCIVDRKSRKGLQAISAYTTSPATAVTSAIVCILLSYA